MASTINASTSPAAIVQTADGTANLSLQSNGTTIAALTSTGMAVTGTLSASGEATISGLTVGKGAGALVTNTIVGAGAFAVNSSGQSNAAFGTSALAANTTGSDNAAFNQNALLSNTSGQDNTGIGVASLKFNTTGSNNTGIGSQALLSNTTASSNTAVGYQAGYSTTTGSANAFFGDVAGRQGNGTYNTFIGDTAGYYTSGSSNALIGQGAGYLITTGTKNTVLGSYGGNQGGLDIRTNSNNIVLSDGDGNPRGIAVGARWSFGGTSDDCVNAYSTGSGTGNSLFVGFKSTTYNGIGGTLSFNVTANGNVTNTNNSYGALSDIKLKENIVDATPKLDDLMKVHICNFNYKTEQTNKQIGVIAQELEEIFPAMVTAIADKDEEGNNAGTTTKSVKYSVFVPMLIKAIQEQQALITSLTARITALEGA